LSTNDTALVWLYRVKLPNDVLFADVTLVANC